MNQIIHRLSSPLQINDGEYSSLKIVIPNITTLGPKTKPAGSSYWYFMVGDVKVAGRGSLVDQEYDEIEKKIIDYWRARHVLTGKKH